MEYVVDAEDEVWLLNQAKFGAASQQRVSTSAPAVTSSSLSPPPAERKKRQINGETKQGGSSGSGGGGTVPLPLSMLEVMLNVLEKETAFDTIITLDQAEKFILQKLPQLYHMYPVRATSGVVAIKHVITDVYNYWVSKRSKLKRPLLRRFWPVTSSDDTNPHLVFRPREKEKYKLRKKRQNDMDAYRKMEQLKLDFAQVRILCGLVKQREELYRSLVLLQREWFRQRFYDAVDTSGLPRVSCDVDNSKLDATMIVERHFEFQDGSKKKKSRKGTQSGKSSRSSTPVPSMGGSGVLDMDMVGGGTLGSNGSGGGGGSTGETPRRPMIIAGQNHGEPAPNFLNPLATRESFTTSWEGAVPAVTTFVNGTPLPTYRFRHRPRVGRGGRLCIDRMPLQANPDFPLPTFYRAGSTQVHPTPSGATPKQSLLDLLPKPIDRERLSQRIEAISLGALSEEYDTPPGRPPPGTEGEENDGGVVLVKMQDWLDTDDQLWGEERYVIGPI